jgi:phage terminase large subunit
MQAEAQFPQKLQCLFEPHRYKILYGGRGGAKSWGIARALLVQGAQKPLRVLCAREFQKSIADSVHQLLKDQIESLGLDSFYNVTETYIEGANGTLFTFHGLKHNVKNIKSIEGTDICWVEEAQTVSKTSWETLIPTIRKDNSEIWVSFNPELEGDETYKRFVKKPPTNAKLIPISYRDNPWFPSVLRQEMEDLKANDNDAYMNVWEGHCRLTLDGAIFAHEIRRALTNGQFTRVPYDPAKPVNTFWDLGRGDMTAIWFVQQVGFEYRIIDYYENCGYALGHYLKILSEKPYHWGEMWLPHDSERKVIEAQLSVEQQMRDAGYKVRITPKTSILDRIEAGRAFFPKCWFDENRCEDGITALKHYQYDVDPDTKERSKNPLHNWASHGSDSFTYIAVAMKDAKPKDKPLKYPKAKII